MVVLNKIKILSEQVANRIVCGEIVQSPSIVIKELIENSLDADANKIKIVFRKGGKSFISITDNGTGMSPEDAILSIKKHATSKISIIKDLENIKTFGFRGEALSSISSVSRFYLSTKTKNQSLGHEICSLGKKLIYSKSCACSVGTKIIVKDLFYNLPIKLKFMKSSYIESNSIIEYVKAFSISQEKVSFSLYNEDKVIFNLPIAISLEERISQIWGYNFIKKMHYIKYSKDGISCEGMISRPSFYINNKKNIFIFVNKRLITSNIIYNSIKIAYENFIPINYFPTCFIFLEINNNEIDFNIHPLKTEILFKRENLIKEIIYKSIINTISNNQISVDYNKNNELDNFLKININDINNIVNNNLTKNITKAIISSKSKLTSWSFICSIKKDFALFKAENGIIFLNIKNTLNRINYDLIINNKINIKYQNTQLLLIPIIFTLDKNSYYKIINNNFINFFQSIGFILECNKNQNYILTIKSIPLSFSLKSTKYLFEKIITNIIYNKKNIEQKDFVNEILFFLYENLKNSLFKEENESNNFIEIIKKLFNCKEPFICPRGYLTHYEISFKNINKKFINFINNLPDKDLNLD